MPPFIEHLLCAWDQVKDCVCVPVISPHRHSHVSSLQLKILDLLLLVFLPKGQRSGVSLSKKLGPSHCECGRR